ncbi:MAG: RidA family protein [Chloroflexaceae bacterium]|nr:RidA family protein [Chloroflexaceae bacterium]
MTRTVIHAAHAPPALGPYSHAIRTEQFVFASGQVPLDPATNQLVAGDVAAQTRQVLLNVQAILTAAGTSLANVVKTTVFLADIADFAAMNAVYAEFFPADPPARSTFQVAALPLGAQVEIEVVALVAVPPA